MDVMSKEGGSDDEAHILVLLRQLKIVHSTPTMNSAAFLTS